MHDLSWALQTTSSGEKLRKLDSYCRGPNAPFTAKECRTLLGNVVLGRDHMVEGGIMLYCVCSDKANFKSDALFGMWNDQKKQLEARLGL